MTRFRQTAWAIALWGVLMAIYAIVTLVNAAGVCEAADLPLGQCSQDAVELAIVLAFVVLWVLGSLLLLATNPHGAVRSILVQVMVNVLALMGTLAILSFITIPVAESDGVTVDTPLLSIPDDLLVVGLLFAIVNALARPVLFALFGRLILRTLGLAIVIVNFVLFWLVSELATVDSDPWITPEPTLLWLFIDSVVFTFVLAVLNAFLGLDRPRLEPRGESRVWRIIDRLPAQRRNALVESIRLQEVYETLSRFGLEIAAGGTALAPVRRLGDRIRGRSSAELEALSTPAKVRVMLQQLGPTFVKVGQIASSRADALPEDWRTELDKLQNTVPPFPWEQARAIIASELGAEPETLFASIAQEPFGAASLAQVHRATLFDGTQVVVKVQRPDIQAKVRADLGVIQELAAVMESRSAVARQIDASGLAREFADGVLEELDYTIEAYHAERLADILSGIPGVGVPRVHRNLSGDRVLTMDFVPGVKATQSDRLDPSIDREAIARTFMRAVIKQVLIDGFFHADPHPGNVMIDTETGTVTFLDLGLVGTLRQEQRLNLLALLWALRTKDPGTLASVVLHLCVATGELDEDRYRADIEQLFYQFWIYGGASFSRMMTALFAALRRHGLRMRSELTLAVKSITQAEELLRAISPGMALVATATHEAERQLRAELTPERAAKFAQGQLGVVLQGFLQVASDRRGDLGPILLDAIAGGRLRSASGPDPTDLHSIAARLESLGARLDELGRRMAVVLGATGLSASLALVLGAVVIVQGIALDGPVLVVGALLAGSLGFLAYTVSLGRRGS
jgi:ubiquinone biosynthesis protein